MSSFSSLPRRLVRAAAATAAITAVAVPVSLAVPHGTASAFPAPVFVMYVPLPETDIHTGFDTRTTSALSNNIVTTIGITAAADNMLLYYDHWEDGYESDIANPVQSTTQVWGDLSIANGARPGVTTDAGDVINGGTVAFMQNNVAVPRVVTDIRYDARDKVAGTRGFALTRAGWDSTIGTVMAGAVAVPDQTRWGTSFSLPVGIDAGEAFEYTGLSVLAATDATAISIDLEGDGIVDQVVTIDEGETIYVDSGLMTGATVDSSLPVMVHIMTADINENYEGRWFEVYPDSRLDNEYVAAVGTTTTAVPVVVYLHNPGSSAISVDVDANGTASDGTVTVIAGGTSSVTLPLNSAGRFSSTSNFAAISATGSQAAGSGDSDYDWGYNLTPARLLTPGVVVGWAPGAPAAGVTYSPVWVAPLAETDIDIDFNADGVVDSTLFDVAANQSVTIVDTADNSMTGARIQSRDGTLISVAWGQNPVGSTPTGGFDLGTAVLPTTGLVTTKTWRLVGDVGGDGLVNPGDMLEYTITSLDAGALSLTNLRTVDQLPGELVYVEGSTTLAGAPYADDSAGTPFPLDATGVLLPLLEPGASVDVTYRATVIDPFPSGVAFVRNSVLATSDQAAATAVAIVDVERPDLYVTKRAAPATELVPGQALTYTVGVENTGRTEQTSVTLTDALPADVEFVAAAVTRPIDGTVTVLGETWSPAAYNNNAAAWGSSWSESDGTQSTSGGNVQIVADGGDNSARLAGTGSWLRRSIDTTGIEDASLTLSYRRSGLDDVNDGVAIEVSENGGLGWIRLDRINGPGTDAGYTTVSYPLDRHLGGALMFRVVSLRLNNSDDLFFVDDVTVRLVDRTTETVATGVPTLSTGTTLLPGESISATVEVRVRADLSPTVTTIANSAAATSAENPAPQRATAEVSIARGEIGDLVWEDLDGDGAHDVGEPGLGGATVTLTDGGGAPVATTTTNPDGSYRFVGLTPGDYTVAVTAGVPAPLAPVTDRDGGTDASAAVSVGWAAVTDADFAFAEPVTIGDLVWDDLDGDGTRGGGEPGLGGVTLDLTDGGGTLVASTVTAGDGSYSFTAPPGTYTVTVDTASLAPGSYSSTGGDARTVTLASGESDRSLDFGYVEPGTIADRVWVDVDGDGLQDGGEPGLDGATVRLLAGTVEVASTTTAAGGIYRFDAIAPGDYQLEFTPPSGYTATVRDRGGDDTADSDIDPVTLTTSAISVGSGSATDDVDAGFYRAASITGRAWIDLDGDAGQGGLEPGRRGVSVELLDLGGTVLGSTVTDPSGDYAFDGLAPGTYRVRFGAPSGFEFTPASIGDEALDSDADAATGVTAAVTLTSGGHADLDAGVYELATIGDTIFDDLDGDGVRDAGEPGLAGVAVTLLDSGGATAATTLSGLGGSYSFVVAPGSYRIAVDLDGWIASPIDHGAEATDSDIDSAGRTALVALTSGAVVDDVDAGMFTPATIGDLVFNDLDGSGGHDPGEPGLDAVTVTLNGTDGSGAAVSMTTTTTAGAYEFTVPPGSYTIDVTSGVPAGSTLTTGNDPTALAVESGDTIDTVDVGFAVAAAVAIVKSTSTPFVLAGGTATFRIEVANTGSVDLFDVTIADPQAPGCDRTIAALAAGATSAYTCTLAGVAADLVNVAGVTARDGFGTSVTDADSAAIDVVAPAVTIAKSPDSQQVVSGVSPTFTITVANTGDVELTGVTVGDPLAAACGRSIGTLAAGASTSYSCTADPALSDYVNVAQVTASAPAGPDLAADDSAVVDVIHPAVAVDKGPDLQYLRPGGDATFVVTVRNTGDVTLDVTVDDSLVPGCDAGPLSIAAGAAHTIGCTVTGVTADFVNTAVVEASDPNGNPLTPVSDTAAVDVIVPSIDIDQTPPTRSVLAGQPAQFTIVVTNTGDSALTGIVVTDPNAPGCAGGVPDLAVGESITYVCSVSSVLVSFTNSVSVDATDPSGQTVSATAPDADVIVLRPSIELQKTPDLQQVTAGGTAVFTLTVHNTGPVDLLAVDVDDPLAPECDVAWTTIPAGESRSHVCTLTGVATDFVNSASVSAVDAADNPAADSDTAAVDVIAPAVSITKTALTPVVALNRPATFEISVANTGDVALTGVAVDDPAAPACDAVLGDLAVAAVVTYTCSSSVLLASLHNVADVVATPPVGPQVGDQDSADAVVLIPAIDVEITPDTQLVGSGSMATFMVTVRNSGEAPLHAVAVASTGVPGCDRVVGDLAPGESTSYGCQSGALTTDLSASVTASGTDDGDNTVIDVDAASVDVVSPELSLDKSPALQTLLAGATADFTIVVTNLGDIDLVDVVVDDPLAAGCSTTIPTLAAGASHTLSCSVAVVATDFTNVATATAADPLGGLPLTAADSAVVDVVEPGVTIGKTPDVQQVVAGGVATFTITVTNTGDRDLVDLAVSDPQAPTCDRVIASSSTPLAAGDSVSYDCTMTVAGDVTNVASVVGTDDLGNPVSGADDADVDAIAPAVAIDKTPDSQSIVRGGTATFTITARNIGDVALHSITVSDPAVPACDRGGLSLAAGESVSWDCTSGTVFAGFTNVASIEALDPNGDPVTGSSDTADVSVRVPAVTISKSPDLQVARAGDDVTFSITVANAGATTLHDVSVDDPATPACDATLGDLAVGASVTYSCTLAAIAADLVNVATVSADDPLGNPVAPASDDATVDVVAPSISITKSPGMQWVVVDSAATFRVDVVNDGDVDLTDVRITDPAVPGCDAVLASLAAGDSTSYTCTTGAGVTGAVTATIGVTATPPVGPDVSDSDQITVDVLRPAVSISKSPAGQVVAHGATATFTITVANTGALDLFSVDVLDQVTPSCGRAGLALAVGESSTWTCTASGVTADFVNIADVVADDGFGHLLRASATAAVTVTPPPAVPGLIQGTAFDDADVDGLDAGRPLTGVTVRLLAGGAEVARTTTDAAGNYRFETVAAGTYRVAFTPPAGWRTSPADVGANGAASEPIDSDVGADGVTLVDVVVTPGGRVGDVDAGFWLPGGLTGVVWYDADADGRATSGERLLSGIGVTLVGAGPDGVFDTADDVVHAPATTSSPYHFGGLVPGRYRIAVDRSSLPSDLRTATYDKDGGADLLAIDVVAGGRLTEAVDFGVTNVAPSVTQTRFETTVGSTLLPLPLADPEGNGPYVVTLVGGSVPTGSTLSTDGSFVGTPTEGGTFVFDVDVCDRLGACRVQSVTIVVAERRLPSTGAETRGLLVVATAMSAFGVVLAAAGRRRRLSPA